MTDAVERYAVVVDASAIVAIVFEEADAAEMRHIIESTRRVSMSAATFFETSMVLVGRKGPAAVVMLDSLIRDLRIAIVPFDAGQATLAREAFIRYGKGRHVAALNFGDCMAYALAKSLDLPLLHKGSDFAATDLKPL
ncbi:MAG: type II toxin-antitoxin system VapC family toxin [Tagaea sp.]|nr:type II toxin-antitoxin system VapC family toxin [Tagaea sp.]